MGKRKRISEKESLSEFIEDPDFYVLFATNGLILGRMIAPVQSVYCKEHQGELVIFNANVLTKTHGKIWYGDLNINLDFEKLKNVADHLKEDLYILMEGDARYGYEKRSIEELLPKARTIIKCNKKIRKKHKKDGNK